MKKSLLTLFVAIVVPLGVFAYTSPGKAAGFVNDFANIISAQDKQAIEVKLQSLKDSTNAEVAVVTVASLGGDTVENYAVKLFQEWGIGVKGKDNGLLILVAPNEREARIEVGYGWESVITDLQAGQIVRNVMVPAFKDNDYSGGISDTVDAVVAVITQSPEAAQYLNGGTDDGSIPASSNLGINFFALFFIIVILLNGLARYLGKTKSWWLGGVIGAVIGAIVGLIWGLASVGVFSIPIFTAFGLLFDYYVSKHPPKSGGGRGGFFPIFFGGNKGGGFGSRGGGGFGGFGGGMSGGGGASGRW
jgi:uncharacterized protein